MRITLGSNVASLYAQRRVNDATESAGRLFEQLSSGLRINRASDDAAGLAIAQDLHTNTRVYTQAILNGNDGQSVLAVADGTLGNLSEIVTRIRELSEQSANGTFSSAQRKTLNTEAQALAKEFFRISRSASFNGINLFDGTLSDGIRFQLGFGTDGSIRSDLGGKLGRGTFAGGTSYSAEGTNSRDVTTGDLNGDGILDLVTTGVSPGLGNGYTTVRLGQGDGTFGSATSYAAESTYSSEVSLGDLNNDGILDLVSAGRGASGGAATVRLGVGDGTFGSAVTYATEGSASAALTLGDLNGDGILDLVTAGGDGSGGFFSVRLGSGSGTFGALTSFSPGGTNSLSDVALGDFNGDGILDIVGTISGRNGSSFSMLGTGTGSFTSSVSTSYDAFSQGSIALGDVNNDGVLDMVLTSDGSGGTMRVRLGNGTGFGTATSYTGETMGSFGLSLQDLNGDGNLDAISVGDTGATGQLTIRLGTGRGTFETAVTYQAESDYSSGVTVADINGDGVPDIITAGTTLAAAGGATTLLGNTRDGISPILPFSLATKADSLQAMGMLDRTLNSVTRQRGVVGAFQARLGVALNTLITGREGFSIAESRIKDVDVASASAELARVQILQRAATAVLAQANLAPQLSLQLLT